ncbi:MAG: EAL domain-containing protein, partial [Pseudomonadota bacterium]|nr:EAL domain-containing protein [Pseudomonadota bacterium]
QTLRGHGHVVHWSHASRPGEVRELIRTRAFDLALVRPGEALPTVAQVSAWIAEAGRDLPLIAVVDDAARQRPARLLRDGAANLFDLADPDHLLAVVDREFAALNLRRQAQRCQALLQELRERCQALLDTSRDAIAYIHEGAHVYANPAYLALFGYRGRDDLEAVTLMELVIRPERETLKGFLRQCSRSARAVEPIRLTGLRADGETRPIQLECHPTRLDGEPCVQVIVQDLAPQQALQQRLEAQSRRDPLTGLHTRPYFIRALEAFLARRQRPAAALLYVLLAGYRSISQRLGLEAGERLLLDAAAALRQRTAEGDVTARFGDAVFTVLSTAGSAAAATAMGESIRQAIAERDVQGGDPLLAGACCIGIRLLDDAAGDAAGALFEADHACETARQLGGNQVQLYRPPEQAPPPPPDADPREEEHLGLIHDALERGRIGLLYQPIVSLRGDALERYKLLLRFPDNHLQSVSMQPLAPVAKRHGLMAPLNRKIIALGLETLARCRQAQRPLVLFVRLSRDSVLDDGLPDWLAGALADHGLPGDALVLEVRESSAEQQVRAVRRLRERLQSLGCGFALSHFGGKPSSERLLRGLEPDCIKLDSALLERFQDSRDAAGDAARQSLAAATQLARTMQIQVVAEGVGNAAQMAGIWQFGVTLVQGDLVREPGPELDFDFRQFAV